MKEISWEWKINCGKKVFYQNIFSIKIFFIFFILVGCFKCFSQKTELVIPTGQNAWVLAHSFTSNQKYYLSAAYDRSINIMDVNEQKVVYTFWKHEAYVTALSISPEDEKVISADINGYILIWDLTTGNILNTIERKRNTPITNISISTLNNSFLASTQRGAIEEYDLTTGELILEEFYHEFPITKMGLIDGDKHFYTAAPDTSLTEDSLVNFWLTEVKTREVKTGFYLTTAQFKSATMAAEGDQIFYITDNPAELRIINWEQSKDPKKIPLNNLNFIPFEIEIISREKLLIAGHRDNFLCFFIYNILTDTFEKEFVTTLKVEERFNLDIKVLPEEKGKIVFNFHQLQTYIWDYDNNILEPFGPSKSWTQLISGGEDYLYLNKNNSLLKFNLKDNSTKVIKSFTNNLWPVRNLKESIFLVGDDNSVGQFTKRTNAFREIFKSDHWIAGMEWEETNNKLLLYNHYNRISVYDLNNDKLEYNLTVSRRIGQAEWLKPNQIIYTPLSEVGFLYILDLKTGIEKQYKIDSNRTQNNIEIIKGNIFISNAGKISVYNPSSGSLIKEVKLRDEGEAYILEYDPEINKIISSFEDGNILFLDPLTLEIQSEFHGHDGFITDISFSHDNSKMYSSSSFTNMKVWDYNNNNLITTVSFLNDDGWVVMEENGLFDASPQAMKEIYYVVNDSLDKSEPWKIIELEQLKHRYYQPGLLQMQLGYNKEPIRTPPPLSNIPLAPKVISKVEKDQLLLQVKNQGGGIGIISIYINNSEVIHDARTEPASMKNLERVDLKVDLSKFSDRFFTSENSIKVVAWNRENWLKSRPVITKLETMVGRGAIAKNQKSMEKSEKPKFYALIAGTSDYRGETIDLNYASKDAFDFSNAIKMAAVNLFGEENVQVELLTTDFDNSNRTPTKKNILERFKSLEKIVRPSDILVVYLSGHGVNFGGAEGDFYYLTAEASGADPTYMADDAVRNMISISSNELTELFNSASAGKKVLILDACAAGKATEKMFLTRDVPSSQIRALDRMQDRTGFYVLAGSAADAVSYESSVYGQGLLTYSLLKAMRGAALRKDGNEEYIDIHSLFQYAVEEVPVLSKEIGGIQKPFFKTPDNLQSYDIGKVDLGTKEKIVLSEPKPMFLEASLSDANLMYDVLDLSNTINGFMENLAATGKGSKLAFTRAKEYPGAYKISGTYSQTEDAILLNFVILRNNKPVGGVKKATLSKAENLELSLKTFFGNIRL